jgi:hypothetical protein
VAVAVPLALAVPVTASGKTDVMSESYCDPQPK